MALNLSGFVTPEQDFGDFGRAGDKLERKAYRDQQLQEQRNAKRSATGKFLQDYLNPKDHLTGTNYDPMIVKGFNDLLAEGASLAKEGADTNTLLMALAPKVNQLSQYSTKAKAISQRLKEQLATIKPGMGYNIPILEEESRKAAFYNPDGSLKDINEVDVNKDYVSETVRSLPEKVTNDAAIDEFVKNSPKFSNLKDITAYTPTGGMDRKKVKLTAPSWLVPDTDEKGVTIGQVPKWQHALEDGQPQTYKFKDKNGKEVEAPIRLLDENEFKSIMSSNPGIADWVRGQVKLADPNADLNSPQAINSARGILYDELKRRMPGSMEDVEIQNKPSSYEIKMNLGLPNGGAGKKKNDTEDFVLRFKKAVGTGNPNSVVDVGRELFAGNGTYKFDNLKVSKEDGGMTLYYSDKEGAQYQENLQPNDPNVYYKMASLYQKITGSDQKLERNIFEGKKDYGSDGAPKPSGKTYSLNGKSYSQSAVEEAAKKSGMSVEAYIKKAGLK